ncbi:hypothetical protein F5887DRAFT_955755 [Amanita rubescens]|nr:hypothetical protein F5887DRAFT_955755 [Amanita rubescens]
MFSFSIFSTFRVLKSAEHVEPVIERAIDDGLERKWKHIAYCNTSPIHRLPPELLGQIFFECVSVGDLDNPNPTACLLVLSHVSKQWRAVALSTPVLWTTFAFVERGWTQVPGSYTYRAERWLNILIDRSGQLPLSFRFSSAFDTHTHPIFSRLVELSHRWKNVRLCLSHLAHPEPLSLPDLEYLILEGHSIPATVGAEPRRTFSLAPRLTRLSLQNCLSPTSSFSFPWSQIRQLHLKGNLICGDDYATILQQATNLESLLIENNEIVPPHPTPIVCTSIKSLTVLTNTTSGCVNVLLTSLVLPNLTHLNVRFWKPPVDVMEAAVQLLDRSGSSITHFTSRDLDDAQLVQLLEKMPHLTHVDLRGSPIGPSLIERLNIYRHPRTQTQTETISPSGPHNLDLDPESAPPGLDDESIGSTPSQSLSSSDTSSPPSSVPLPPYLVPKLESLLLSDNSLTPDLNGLADAIISRIRISREPTSAGAISPLKQVRVLLRKDVESAAVSQLEKLSETEWGKCVMVGLTERGSA